MQFASYLFRLLLFLSVINTLGCRMLVEVYTFFWVGVAEGYVRLLLTKTKPETLKTVIPRPWKALRILQWFVFFPSLFSQKSVTWQQVLFAHSQLQSHLMTLLGRTQEGQRHLKLLTVGREVSSDIMLVDYLRNTLELRGTKYMCREAGCGACTVNASTGPGSGIKAINSCMVSVTSCQDWDITTIEGLGNKLEGYHPLQTALAEHHGTQCGYCTPGWIMNMNGLLESTNRNVTMLEVEQSFGSNICRCTGYRPIAECFKKFARDTPKEHRIEDIENLTICKKKGKPCKGNRNGCTDDEDWCIVSDEDLLDPILKRIRLRDGKTWYRPTSIHDVLGILLNESSGSNYMLVAGNTAKGVFPIDEYPPLLIDISHLQELKVHYFDQNLVVGAGLTLTEFLSILKSNSTLEYFNYLEKLYEHILLVAHIPVRNVGTIAGNLMIKHKYNVFQSDIFLLLETVGAQICILDCHGQVEIHTMRSFLRVNMNQKIILKVLLPPLSNEYQLITFKIMPRAQSVHAIVNAGFLFRIDKQTNIVKQARIVYGALSPKFIRASATESLLVGKPLFTNQTLRAALGVLEGELIVEENPPEPSVAYRRHLAKALFYKALLTLSPPIGRTPRNNSGILRLHESRGLSDAKQNFTTDPTKWPLNQPIQKVEALYQCSGEAVYTEDMPALPNEVFGAFVLSTVAVATIVNIDATSALRLKGVLAFYTAKDIPGLNSFTPAESILYTSNEEVLADGTVKYYGQPLGIIVAEDQHIANRAVKLVKVTYRNTRKPVLDIKTAKEDTARNTLFFSADATNRGTDVQKVITGNTTFYGQYHFTMETLVAVAKPTEEGLEVHSATQWLDGSHVMISRALGIEQNKIDMYLRRLGGAYGIKISRSIQSAIACSLVSLKLNRPCRFIQPLTTNMEAVGKRLPYTNDYEIAVNRSGVIQYVNHTIYEDNGYKTNETLTALGVDVYYNFYDVTKFNYRAFDTITDTAKNTWCRSPGTLEAIAACEYLMERISYELSLDPVAVRLANLDTTKYNDLPEIVNQFKIDTEYTTRKSAVDSFNTQNRWKKRGLRFSFARWSPIGAQRFDVNMSVFQGDGSIVITHAGVEMGQGINTKAVQTAAYLLKVPIEKIQIKANNTIIAPNSFISGGSLTTQSVIIGLRRCCEQLLARLEPIRATLTNPTWEELIKAAYNADVDLQAHGFAGSSDIQQYNVYGISLAEVEIDCLTGEYEVLRVDLLQDVGLSVSPEIDVGQVEGGYIMAMGYWTCEKLVYDKETGKLLTNRTWDYQVPEMRDIPQNFNVYFRKSSYSNDLILGSKATGEPSSCAAVSVAFALREAIALARQETGIPTTQWFEIDGPFSTEAVCLSANSKPEDYKF